MSKIINKIGGVQKMIKGDPVFEITIKKDKDILYQNKGAIAGVVNVVEEVQEFDADTDILRGTSQNFAFGKHTALMLYSFDQLRQYVQKLATLDTQRIIDFIKKGGGKLKN